MPAPTAFIRVSDECYNVCAMSQHALRAANEAFYAAFASLDHEQMMELWARHSNVTCVHPGWDLVVGPEAVAQSFRSVFEGMTQLQFRVEIASITAGPTLGWVVCREFLLTDVQGTPVENAMTAINTFVLEDNVWRVSHHHTAPMLAGRASPRGRTPDAILH